MQVNGFSQIHQAHSANAPHAKSAAAGQGVSAPTKVDTVDQLDISPEAQVASESSGGDGVRTDLVARLQAEIAGGGYDTDEKLDIAMSRMLDQMG